MTDKPIIEVKNLGKKYDIAMRRGGYLTLRDSLANAFRRPASLVSRKKEAFWALRGASFSVRRGEVVGVIGANGAGKSTLLKILSQITPPTEGEVILRGRVGSLLEVGTGFHPELTGRENIFLNGAILGMKRREIAAKFDQIVEFAGVGKFLDTPVKHYSSGMYVRLAFSVAAHMEPDILLIDEVLAVGDAEFQQKCLGKMDEITRTEGRTILFVSHNLQAIERLCERTVVLDHGRVAFVGETGEAIALYTRSMSARSGEEDLRGRHDRRGTGNVRLTKVSFYDPAGKPVSRAVAGEPLVVGLSYESQGGKPLENCQVNFSWKSAGGQGLFVCSSDLTHPERFDLPPSGEVRCKIPRFPLGKGVYTLGALFRVNMQIEDWVLNAATLECESGDFYGKGSTAAYWPGESVMVEHEWLI